MEQSELDDLHLAAVQIAAQLQLTNIPRSAWTLAQRKDYLDHFIALVKANPDNFAPETIATANAINTSSYYFDYSAEPNLAVADAVLGAAASVSAPVAVAHGLIDALNGVGSGLSTAGNLLPLVIPLMLVAGAILLAKSGAREAKSLVSF